MTTSTMTGVFDEEELTNLLVAVESYLDEIGYIKRGSADKVTPFELQQYQKMEHLKKKLQSELRMVQGK